MNKHIPSPCHYEGKGRNRSLSPKDCNPGGAIKQQCQAIHNWLLCSTAVSALAGAAQWIEHQPANQNITGLIPSQGTCLGCGPGAQQGARERHPHIDVSLPLFLPPFPSLKINKIFKNILKRQLKKSNISFHALILISVTSPALLLTHFKYKSHPAFRVYLQKALPPPWVLHQQFYWASLLIQTTLSYYDSNKSLVLNKIPPAFLGLATKQKGREISKGQSLPHKEKIYTNLKGKICLLYYHLTEKDTFP